MSLYNNSAKNRDVEAVHKKTMKIMAFNLMQERKYAWSSYSYLYFFHFKRADILIPDFQGFHCFVLNRFSIFFLLTHCTAQNAVCGHSR